MKINNQKLVLWKLVSKTDKSLVVLIKKKRHCQHLLHGPVNINQIKYVNLHTILSYMNPE